MMRRCLACIMLTATIAGCHKPEDYVVGPSHADEVLKLTLSATTLPADGIARATVTAQLDPQTDADKRTVTFTTTAGTLIAGGKEATTIVVQANISGTAVAELRSTTIAATAQVTATVATVTRTASVEFQLLAREQVYGVSVSADSIPADDFSTSVITVELRRIGTLEQRAVKFETSLGLLVPTGQPSARAVTLPADVTGKAVVELRSDGIVGTARVRVTALDLSYEFQVTFTQLRAAEVLDVAVSRESIPADGFSTTVITATLKRNGTPAQRVVKFDTSAGMLIAAGQLAVRTVTVPADATGRAVVELQSDRNVGTARVRVTAFEVPVEFPIEFTPVTPSNIITVSNDPASAPADGATSIIVSAKVAAGLPAARRSVTFRTTLGLLLPTSIVEADGSNVARVSLVSSIAGTARITATVDGVSAETNAEFTPALPDRIVVAPDAVQLKSDGSTTIRVTLLRSPGNVSSRLVVSYSATTSTGASIGSFSRITLAEGSQSTAMFNVNTTSYVGPVTIRASVDGGASGTAVVDIVR